MRSAHPGALTDHLRIGAPLNAGAARSGGACGVTGATGFPAVPGSAMDSPGSLAVCDPPGRVSTLTTMIAAMAQAAPAATAGRRRRLSGAGGVSSPSEKTCVPPSNRETSTSVPPGSGACGGGGEDVAPRGSSREWCESGRSTIDIIMPRLGEPNAMHSRARWTPFTWNSSASRPLLRMHTRTLGHELLYKEQRSPRQQYNCRESVYLSSTLKWYVNTGYIRHYDFYKKIPKSHLATKLSGRVRPAVTFISHQRE